jgi:pimeloyl-ACP methyl ester carboxylesterase
MVAITATITTDVTTGDGVRLACTEYGPCEESAVPVLLLHGLAGHTAEWDALAELLGPAYRLVGYDARGHGRSDRLPEDVSRAAHVRDAVAVAGQLALARPVLIGQSLGGLTALLTAAAHPDPGSVVRILPGSRGLARTLAALSSVADAPRGLLPPPCDRTHQAPLPDPA